MRFSKAQKKFATKFKKKLHRELKDSGFKITSNSIVPPNLSNKNALRKAHKAAKQHLLLKNKDWIVKNENLLRDNFADGKDIIPSKIYPKLVLVNTQKKADLFRYASYLWSIPLSNGFGRRLRYLVIDKSNKKLIGLIGLTDPMIGLKVRDRWIGWSTKQKEKMLWHVMDAYAFGAIPPYSYLLGGKLVATLMTSDKIRRDFKKKYSHGKSEILHKQYKKRGADLVLLTTTGAFGESSILDRLKGSDNRLLWNQLGFTEGWGFFHLNNGVASDMFNYLKAINDPIVKKHKFGQGPNWKMRLLSRGMKELGIDYRKYTKHGVKRGFYVAPLAKNSWDFLNQKVNKPHYYAQSVSDQFTFFRERYLIPRSERDDRWINFHFNRYSYYQIYRFIK